MKKILLQKGKVNSNNRNEERRDTPNSRRQYIQIQSLWTQKSKQRLKFLKKLLSQTLSTAPKTTSKILSL